MGWTPEMKKRERVNQIKVSPAPQPAKHNPGKHNLQQTEKVSFIFVPLALFFEGTSFCAKFLLDP